MLTRHAYTEPLTEQLPLTFHFKNIDPKTEEQFKYTEPLPDLFCFFSSNFLYRLNQSKWLCFHLFSHVWRQDNQIEEKCELLISRDVLLESRSSSK